MKKVWRWSSLACATSVTRIITVSDSRISIPESFLRADHLLGEKLYNLIVEETSDPVLVSQFLRLLYGQSKKENLPVRQLAESFIQHINESAAFHLDEWVNAMVVLYKDCIADLKFVPWGNALGYIHCCAEAGGAGEEELTQSLGEMTAEFYQKYGILVE